MDAPRTPRYFLVGLLCVAAGLALLVFALQREVTLVIQGEAFTTQTFAPDVAAYLQSAEMSPELVELLEPVAEQPLMNGSVIRILSPQPVQIWADGAELTFEATDRRPGNLLALAGIQLFPGDQVFSDGRPVQVSETLTGPGSIALHLVRAHPITLWEGSRKQVLHSTAATLGQALWEADIRLQAADELSLSLETPLDRILEVSLSRARDLTVLVGGETLNLQAAGNTVGEALAAAGLGLQGLDYSRPSEDSPLPQDGRIEIVQVREEVNIEQVPLPFETTFKPDPTLEIDNQRILKPGEFGLQAVRERVRYENNVEVSRESEAAWVAVEPKPRVMGYGTNIVVRTLDTPDGTIEYWRAVTMYATSYSPCRIFNDRCSYQTASGATLDNGIAAVLNRWYRTMGGNQVYVPGYGVASILDTGRGIPGRNWIDLGYNDEDWISWHSWVTVYFLTPVPSPDRILYILN